MSEQDEFVSGSQRDPEETESVTCLGSGLSPEEEEILRVGEDVMTFSLMASPAGAATVWSADYDGATVRDIPSSNWSMANREHDLDINMVIIHYTQGTSFAPIAFGPGGLAHYGVSRTGAVDQYINERYIVWHAGNWPVNQHSVGIEHVGFGRPEDWTDAMLHASAKLVANICKRRNIPVDRNHIKGHNEVSGPGGHTDPGNYFPWSKYMGLVRQYRSGGSVEPHAKKYKPNAKNNLINPGTEWSQRHVDAFKKVANELVGKEIVDGITSVEKARAVSQQSYESEPVGKLRVIAVGDKSVGMLSGDAKSALGHYPRNVTDIWDGRHEQSLFNSLKALLKSEAPRADIDKAMNHYRKLVGWPKKMKEHEEGPLTLKELNRIYDVLPDSEYAKRIDGLNSAMRKYNIIGPYRMSAFLGNLAEESACLKYVEELASGSAYEGRGDLGNTHPGDGIRFKGRGYIQITGRANYTQASRDLDVDFVENPELMETPKWAAMVSAWFWNSRALNGYADQGNQGWPTVCLRINGRYPANGQVSRDKYYSRAWEVLK